MKYEIQFKPQALKDLKKIPTKKRRIIVDKIELLQQNLHGDVKQLTNFTPEYRLRVGDYRILFEIDDNFVIIYRIRHRKDAYS